MSELENIITPSDSDSEQNKISGKSTETNNDTKDWLEGLGDEFKNNKSLNKFNDIKSLAQSYLEMEKNYATRVKLPSSESKEEEWNDFYKKFGRPENKEYFEGDDRNKLAPSEIEQKSLQMYEDMFHSSGLSRRQGKAMLEHMMNLHKAQGEQQNKESTKIREDNLKQIENKYSSNWQDTLSSIKQVMNKYSSSGLGDIIEASNYHPALIDLLLEVSKNSKNDKIITDNNKNYAINSKNTAKETIKTLEQDKEFMLQYRDRSHPRHEEAMQKLKKLYDQAYN